MRVSVGRGGKRSEVMEMQRLSLDSMRRGWEKSGDVNKSRGRSKEMGTSSDSASVVSDAKASPRKTSLLKDRILSNSPLKCQNNTFSINITKKPSKKDIKLPKQFKEHKEASTPSLPKEPKEASTPSRPKEPKEASTPSRPKDPKEVSTPSRPKELKEANIPGRFIKVPLKLQEWSDQSISWDLLPTGIHDSGKDAICCRNTTFLADVDALHEATTSENVIQYMRPSGARNKIFAMQPAPIQVSYMGFPGTAGATTLKDIEIAFKLVGFEADNDDSLDENNKKLGCNISPLAYDSEDFQLIKNYLHTTHTPTHGEYINLVYRSIKVSKSGVKKRNR